VDEVKNNSLTVSQLGVPGQKPSVSLATVSKLALNIWAT
jgi:hypothetical protein